MPDAQGRRRPRLPRRIVPFHRALLQIHRWVGIATGLYICIVCITGAALVFRIELQRASYPQLFTPRAVGPQAEPRDVLESVKATYPQHRVSGIDAPTTARPVYLAYAVRGDQFATILLDPASADVLGELPSTGFVRTLQDLHFNLLAGSIGRRVNGIGAICLLTMCVTGLVIWWPGMQTWRRSLRVDFSRGWRRVIWELHSATGIWTVTLIALWAITGVSFAFPRQFRSAVRSLAPVTIVQTPVSSPPASTIAARPTWSELIDTARTQVPDQHIARIVVPSSSTGAFLVMFSKTAPTPASGADLTSVYLDQYSGDVLEEPSRAARTMGDVVMDWVAPLHVGNFDGTGVKIVWLVLGLAPPLLFVTGFLMWWKRLTPPT